MLGLGLTYCDRTATKCKISFQEWTALVLDHGVFLPMSPYGWDC